MILFIYSLILRLLRWRILDHWFDKKIIDHKVEKDKELEKHKSSLSIFAEKEKQDFQKSIVWFRIVREKKIEVYQEMYRLYVWAENICYWWEVSVHKDFSTMNDKQIIRFFKLKKISSVDMIYIEKLLQNWLCKETFKELNRFESLIYYWNQKDKIIEFKNYFFTNKFYLDKKISETYNESISLLNNIVVRVNSIIERNDGYDKYTEVKNWILSNSSEIEKLTWEYLNWLD